MAKTRDDIIGREAAVLRALCHAGAWERREAVELLAGYPWQEPDHQWIFEALSELGTSEALDVKAPENLHFGAGGGREELAGRLARRGFPDVDLEGVFAPAPASGQSPQELARELLAQAARRGRRR